MDREKTLAFLAQLSDQAIQESRQGNTLLANRMGQNAAIQHYFNNVHTRRVMTPIDWAAYHPNYLAEADRVRVEYEQAETNTQTDNRVDTLEKKFDNLEAKIDALIEAQNPKKPRRGKKVVEEADADTTEEKPATDESPEEESEEEDAE